MLRADDTQNYAGGTRNYTDETPKAVDDLLSAYNLRKKNKSGVFYFLKIIKKIITHVVHVVWRVVLAKRGFFLNHAFCRSLRKKYPHPRFFFTPSPLKYFIHVS